MVTKKMMRSGLMFYYTFRFRITEDMYLLLQNESKKQGRKVAAILREVAMEVIKQNEIL